MLNSVLFYSLLFVGSDSCDGESLSSELSYLIRKQSLEETVKMTGVLGLLADVAAKLLQEQRQQQAVDVIRAVLYNGWTKIAKIVMELNQVLPTDKLFSKTKTLLGEVLPSSRMRDIASFCQRSTLSASAIHDWLIHKNR